MIDSPEQKHRSGTKIKKEIISDDDGECCAIKNTSEIMETMENSRLKIESFLDSPENSSKKKKRKRKKSDTLTADKVKDTYESCSQDNVECYSQTPLVHEKRKRSGKRKSEIAEPREQPKEPLIIEVAQNVPENNSELEKNDSEDLFDKKRKKKRKLKKEFEFSLDNKTTNSSSKKSATEFEDTNNQNNVKERKRSSSKANWTKCWNDDELDSISPVRKKRNDNHGKSCDINFGLQEEIKAEKLSQEAIPSGDSSEILVKSSKPKSKELRQERNRKLKKTVEKKKSNTLLSIIYDTSDSDCNDVEIITSNKTSYQRDGSEPIKPRISDVFMTTDENENDSSNLPSKGNQTSDNILLKHNERDENCSKNHPQRFKPEKTSQSGDSPTDLVCESPSHSKRKKKINKLQQDKGNKSDNLSQNSDESTSISKSTNNPNRKNIMNTTVLQNHLKVEAINSSSDEGKENHPLDKSVHKFSSPSKKQQTLDIYGFRCGRNQKIHEVQDITPEQSNVEPEPEVRKSKKKRKAKEKLKNKTTFDPDNDDRKLDVSSEDSMEKSVDNIASSSEKKKILNVGGSGSGKIDKIPKIPEIKSEVFNVESEPEVKNKNKKKKAKELGRKKSNTILSFINDSTSTSDSDDDSRKLIDSSKNSSKKSVGNFVSSSERKKILDVHGSRRAQVEETPDKIIEIKSEVLDVESKPEVRKKNKKSETENDLQTKKSNSVLLVNNDSTSDSDTDDRKLSDSSEEILNEKPARKSHKHKVSETLTKKRSSNSKLAEYLLDENPDSDLEVEARDIEQMIHDVEEEDRIPAETVKKLRGLRVTLKHVPPPQHRIESCAGSRGPTAHQRKMFEKFGPIKNGTFTPDEDELIVANWKSFCKIHNWDYRDVKPFLRLRHHERGCVTKFKDRLKFAQFLANGLPWRLLYSVYWRFRNLYQPHKVRTRYTKEEDKMILAYVENSSTAEERNVRKFSQLAKLMNRTRASLWGRYQLLKQMKSPNAQIQWNLHSVSKLMRNLMRQTRSTDVEQLKDLNIPTAVWREIADKFKTDFQQIKHFWLSKLHQQLFCKECIYLNDIKIKLIEYFHVKGITQPWEIKWREVAKHFDGMTAVFLRQRFVRMIDTAQYENMEFQDILEHLYQMKKSEIQEAPDDKFLPRLTYENGRVKPYDLIKDGKNVIQKSTNRNNCKTEK